MTPHLNPALAGLTTAVVTAPATTDMLQSLIIALLSLGVRELFAWYERRRRKE